MKTRSIFSFMLLISAIEALGCAVYLLAIPADTRNALWLGFSLPRLLVLAFLLALFFIFLGFAARVFFRKGFDTGFLRPLTSNSRTARGALLAVFTVFILSWIGVFLPSYRVGVYEAYFTRLKPLLVWLVLVAGQVLVFSAWQGSSLDRLSIQCFFSRNSAQLKTALVVLALSLFFWAFTAITRVGITPDSVQWNDAGAPLLGLQVLFAATCCAVFLALEQRLLRFKYLDVAISLLIWLGSFLLWMDTPLLHNFFAPGPYPPNHEYYPFSDSLGYDLSSQFALIGQRLGNSGYVDKPLYSAFLTFLHSLAGLRFDPAVRLQVAVFALCPVLVYFIGKNLRSRAAGLTAAILIAARETNTILISTWLLTTNSKLIMSEALATLGISIFALFLVKWLADPGKKTAWLFASAGVLGLLTLVRHNPWLFLPFLLFMVGFVFRRDFRRGLLMNALVIGMILMSIAPWMVRSQVLNGRFLYFLGPMRSVVVGTRYPFSFGWKAAPSLSAPSLVAPAIQTPAADSNDLGPTAAPSPPPAAAPSNQTLPSDRTLRFIVRSWGFITAHFSHNLIATSAVLPPVWIFDNLEAAVKAPGSVWSPGWNGELTPSRASLLLLELMLLALGVGFAVKHWRWSGLVPIGVYLVYAMATAVARTSGGRYIFPVDWVIILYYSFGLAQILVWTKGVWTKESHAVLEPVTDPLSQIKESHFSKNGFWVWAAFLFIGSLLPLTDVAFPRRYPERTVAMISDQLVTDGWAAKMGVSEADLTAFTRNENARVLEGRALYPRYYRQGQGEPDSASPNRELPFPRIVFTLIGPKGKNPGVLPLLSAPTIFPNSSDMIMLGCQNQSNVDVWGVVLTYPKPALYVRDPKVPLICPLPPPVCDENKVCR